MTNCWPEELLTREFRPRDVEVLTGYSTELQYKWADRYNFTRTSRLFTDREGGRGSGRWWSWTGLQLLTIFGDVIGDLKDHKFARAAVMFEKNGRVDTTIYEHDFRDNGGDLMVQTDLSGKGIYQSSDGDPLFVTTAPAAPAQALELPELAEMRPDRLYLYNFSGMQRRLVSRLEAFDQRGGASIMNRAEFAQRIGRHPSAVTRAIESGRIGGDALQGEGRSARIVVDVAIRQLGLHSAPLNL